MRERLRMEQRPEPRASTSAKRRGATTAESGTYPPAMPLPKRHDVRHHPIRLQRRPGAGPAGAGQHLVGYQQDAMTVAGCADAPPSTPAPAPTRRSTTRRPARRCTAATVSGSLANDRRLHRFAAAARTERRRAAARAAVGVGRRHADDTRRASPESRSCSARGRRRRARGACCRDRLGESATILRRPGSPASTQYCRASLSAASTASDPLASG